MLYAPHHYPIGLGYLNCKYDWQLEWLLTFDYLLWRASHWTILLLIEQYHLELLHLIEQYYLESDCVNIQGSQCDRY